jgi:hypothetical protein
LWVEHSAIESLRAWLRLLAADRDFDARRWLLDAHRWVPSGR